MSVYRDKDWVIDAAVITPSVITQAPYAQPTVRLLISYGCTAHSIDIPADAAEKLALALPDCVKGTREAFKKAYGEETA